MRTPSNHRDRALHRVWDAMARREEHWAQWRAHDRALRAAIADAIALGITPDDIHAGLDYLSDGTQVYRARPGRKP